MFFPVLPFIVQVEIFKDNLISRNLGDIFVLEILLFENLCIKISYAIIKWMPKSYFLMTFFIDKNLNLLSAKISRLQDSSAGLNNKT